MVKRLDKIALCASIFAFSVIALGALTRLLDAGLGCPDWPGCYGHMTVLGALQDGTTLVPYKAWLEMIHRYFVGGLSLLVLVIVASIFGLRQFRTRVNCVLASALVVLLLYQILLGRFTVTLKLLPAIVSQHLLGGFLILSCLWLIFLNLKPRQFYTAKHHEKKFLPFAIIALVLVFLQISLGAWTSTNYAALSCSHFPFCQRDAVMVWDFKEAFQFMRPIGVNYDGGVLAEPVRQTIQMTHRMGALIVTLYLVILMMCAMPGLRYLPHLQRCLFPILGLLSVQLCLGISNVIFKLPLITALGHNLVAAMLLLSVLTWVFELAILDKQEASV